MVSPVGIAMVQYNLATVAQMPHPAGGWLSYRLAAGFHSRVMDAGYTRRPYSSSTPVQYPGSWPRLWINSQEQDSDSGGK